VTVEIYETRHKGQWDTRLDFVKAYIKSIGISTKNPSVNIK